MFEKGTTHKLKPKSLQPLTLPLDLAALTLDPKLLVHNSTVYLNLHYQSSPLLTYSLSWPPRKLLPKREHWPEAISPHIVELPPSNPPSLPPALSDSQDDSNYKAPPGDLATTLTLLAQSLSIPKKSSGQTKVHELVVFNGSDTCKLQPFLVLCTLNFRDCCWDALKYPLLCIYVSLTVY